MLTPEQARGLDALLFDGREAADEPPGPGDRPLPERVGPYRIRRLLGEGGMGFVYEAEQTNPRRLVALKVLRAGLASRSAMRRFHHEVEVLAHLRHPGIAQIHDAGTHDEGAGGVPYFAMEYLPGARPIHEYAQAHDLSLRQRLELFAEVCDAVHHGHQKGVIHRDLKPENILVDEDRRAKVIDFGVARATDGDVTLTTLHTDAKHVVGTLQYMSPEQCDGERHEIDTRSDVYALGVVFYELLTGCVPYDLSHKSIHAAVRLIQEAEPARPGSFRRDLRGPVETIVLKAIDKDPQRRYGSAADLARDIRRHLSGEPVEARAPSAWTRGVRWVLRHPVLTTAAVCVAIAATTLGLTVGGVWWYAQRPDRVEVSPDRSEARLVSVGGRALHTWRAEVETGVKFGQLVPRISAVDSTPLVLIGFVGGARWPGGLHGFPVRGDRDTPLWSARIGDEDLPDELGDAPAASYNFHPHYVALDDVFPSIPGPEVIVAHTGATAESVLRIYDLEGKVLFQVWHNGNIRGFCWLSPESTLVMSALNAEVFWYQRGAARYDEGFHPAVLFAIRPRLGDRTREWVRTSGRWGSFEPLWYKALLPGEWKQIVKAITLNQAGHRPEAGDFTAQLRLRQGFAGITLFFDASGREVGERVPNNPYRVELAAGRVPPPDSFRFGPLPPIEPSGPPPAPASRE